MSARSPPGTTASVSARVESCGGRSQSATTFQRRLKGNQRAREASGPEASDRLEQY